MIKQFLSKEFASFLITGGIAATVNFLSRIIFNRYFNFSMSVILAYLVGMITAFTLAKTFVFKGATQSVGRSACIFTLVNVFAILQTWLVSMGLNYYVLPTFGINYFAPEISNAIGIIFPVFTSYFGHKHWSFR